MTGVFHAKVELTEEEKFAKEQEVVGLCVAGLLFFPSENYIQVN
jgi:hypothetical protein